MPGWASVASPETPRRSPSPQRWDVATSTDCTRAACHRCSADYCAHACHPKAKPDPLMVRHRDEWIGHAACIGQHVNTFMPERTSAQRDRPPGGTPAEARALRFCSRCSVRRECALDVLVYEVEGQRRPLPSGVAGGSTERQRRALHRRDLSITEKAEEIEDCFLKEVVPLILAPSESPMVSTVG